MKTAIISFLVAFSIESFACSNHPPQASATKTGGTTQSGSSQSLGSSGALPKIVQGIKSDSGRKAWDENFFSGSSEKDYSTAIGN